MSANRIKGSSAFLALLKDEGVFRLFGNPGTTELPVMDALKAHPDMDYVLALQESLVVAMADGYARASGELTACNVHVAPGLGNAMGALYNAKFTNSPMILTAGQQEQGHGLMEPLLYDELLPMAAPLVKWAVEVTRLEDLPRIMHRAAKVAMTAPKGPVFISLPGDILNDEAGLDLGAPTRVETRVRPADDVLETLAQRLLEAKNPAVIAGPEVVTSDAFDEIAQFAETLGAAAYLQTINWGAFYPSEHPTYMGALSRVQTQVRDTLAPYDLLIFAGADVLRMSVMSEIEPLPAGMPVIQLGLDDWEMGKNYAAEMAVRADLKETLTALVPALERLGGAAHAKAATDRIAALADTNWTAKRAAKVTKTQELAMQTPIATDWLCLQAADALPANGVFVNEGLTTTFGLLEVLPCRDRYGFHALASGGIGWGLPAAIGIQLAHPGRPVLALVGDGSAMYSIQALWTAAHHKLPIVYLIANNRGYRIIKQRLKAFHGNEHYVGMDFEDPEIDFVALAQSLGMSAERIEDPQALRPALDKALANGGPVLLDVVVERGV